ncbi:hypothetical protein CI102_4018 [Trichoderma harzianum]|nr:hypothetical protein CI102_4018 [Trichoderma harzianum]
MAWHGMTSKSFSAFSITPPPYSLYFPHGPRADSRLGPAWGKTGEQKLEMPPPALPPKGQFSVVLSGAIPPFGPSPFFGGWSGRGGSQPGAAPFQRPLPTASAHSRAAWRPIAHRPNLQSGVISELWHSKLSSIEKDIRQYAESCAMLYSLNCCPRALAALVARITSHHGRLFGGLPDRYTGACKDLDGMRIHGSCSRQSPRQSPRAQPMTLDRIMPRRWHSIIQSIHLAINPHTPGGSVILVLICPSTRLTTGCYCTSRRERFELDAGVDTAASDLSGRNVDGPNTCPANSPRRFRILETLKLQTFNSVFSTIHRG